MSFSIDGSTWTGLGTALTPSATATNVWLMFSNTVAHSAYTPIWAIDWIRQGSNNLDPWSHSGLVQLDSVPEWMTALAGRVAGETAHTDDDFFGQDSSGDYTEQTVTGTATWTISRGLLSVKANGQSAGDVSAYLKSITSASSPMTIEAAIKSLPLTATTSGDRFQIGFGFTDGTAAASNSAIAAYSTVTDQEADPDGFVRMSGGTLTDWENATNTLTRIQRSANPFGLLYMRLIWTAANSFQMALSTDGVSWTALLSTTLSKTITPTHFGFVVASKATTSGEDLITSFDYLRVYDSDLSV